MSTLFSHAKRHQWIADNPITEVRTSAKRQRIPDELMAWREVAPYSGDDDFIFASERRDGKTPIAPDMVLKKRIRPALKRAGIVGKVIGWHSFRHGLGTMLRQAGVDVKTAQEILRHANSRITQDIYQQAVSPEKREAQNKVMLALEGGKKKGA
jgi:integrase